MREAWKFEEYGPQYVRRVSESEVVFGFPFLSSAVGRAVPIEVYVRELLDRRVTAPVKSVAIDHSCAQTVVAGRIFVTGRATVAFPNPPMVKLDCDVPSFPVDFQPTPPHQQ